MYAGGDVVKAGEVRRRAGARYRVDKEPVPRVGHDDRRTGHAQRGGQGSGGDRVSPAADGDDEWLHSHETTGHQSAPEATPAHHEAYTGQWHRTVTSPRRGRMPEIQKVLPKYL